MIERVLAAARAERREVLLEPELLAVFAELGVAVPRHQLLPVENGALHASELDPGLAGRPGVLKLVSPEIVHKSDAGGVALLGEVTPESVPAAARRMLEGLTAAQRASVRGLLLEERVRYEAGLGHELLLGLRQSEAFGPVFTLGFGGTAVEELAAATARGQSTILFAPGLTTEEQLAHKLEHALFFRWATGRVRGQVAASSAEALRQALGRLVAAIEELCRRAALQGRLVTELEFNPLVFDAGREAWLPLDARARLAPLPSPARPFPVPALARALHPERVALLGVSARSMNVGRIILRSLLEGGFPTERVRVIREDGAAIDGVPGVPSLEALPAPVDLLVVAVAACSVPETVERALASGRVGAVLLIPGGMGETAAGQRIEREVQETLDRHAESPHRPVLIGNNSLGLVSRPARFDTLFIPREKLPRQEQGLRHVALISQSGAFIITALTKLHFLGPDYQISLGNQIDARVSHFVEALAGDSRLTTFALYIEGLKPGDGRRLAEQVRRLVEGGRDVVVYKAGRSALGRSATMGHTASVAGDYRIFAEALSDAGALVAETFSEFVDLVGLSAMLHGKRFAGCRVGLMSNAGYEAVGLADNHRGPGHELEPAPFEAATVARLGRALAEAHIAELVTVANPLDITPMASDAVHEACMRAILDDPGVDLALFGNVPLTSMVQSLPRGVSERDVFDAPGGYARRTAALFRESAKPFVVVIDAGRYYDPLADELERAGVPVFRSGDRAIRALGRYAAGRCAVPPV